MSPCTITFQLESTTYAECVCSLRYPACNVHAPYIHLWPAWFYIIFPHCLINGKIWEEKKLLNTKCVFRFSLQLFPETFLIPRNERDMIKTVCWSSGKASVILLTISTKHEFSRDILEKYKNIKFHEIPSSGSRVFPCAQPDGRTDMTKLTVAFRKFRDRP